MIDREELERLHEAATAGPWNLCQHLKSVEHDKGCSCGYRGVIWGPEYDMAMAVFQPGHDPAPEGEEGLAPERYPRELEIANSHLAVYLRNAVPDILTLLTERDTLAAENAKLRGDLNAAIAEVTKWALEAGEAKGKLEASELPGIVDGWREKCERLEAENAALKGEEC